MKIIGNIVDNELINSTILLGRHKSYWLKKENRIKKKFSFQSLYVFSSYHITWRYLGSRSKFSIRLSKNYYKEIEN